VRWGLSKRLFSYTKVLYLLVVVGWVLLGIPFRRKWRFAPRPCPTWSLISITEIRCSVDVFIKVKPFLRRVCYFHIEDYLGRVKEVVDWGRCRRKKKKIRERPKIKRTSLSLFKLLYALCFFWTSRGLFQFFLNC
jgi:hypothetical protein